MTGNRDSRMDSFTPEDHPRGENGRFTDKPTMYESASGGKVTKSYAGTPKEETQNLAAAKVLADKKGWKVDLQFNTPNRKSADAKINGEYWEIKTNYTPTKNSIDTLLKSAKGQSGKIILHIQSDIGIRDVITTARARMNRSAWIENVLVITKKEKLILLTR